MTAIEGTLRALIGALALLCITGYPLAEPLTPDPLDAAGDELYEVYRKNFIGRHLSSNGRVHEWLALESVEEFDPNSYDGRGYIDVSGSDGTTLRHRVDNVRYSMEALSPSTPPRAYMWVPAVGMAADAGTGKSGYYAVGGGGDNPLYWGGMALATFSLEAIHGVSKHSLHYARRIVEFALRSEMPGRNGYMIRSAHHFNSIRSKNGERIFQGASAEELLGLMLGLMYYTKAESPSHPLRAEAVALRDRVLGAVSRGRVTSNYRHAFMTSHNTPYYGVKHFEFPLYASRGSESSGVMRTYYRNALTLSAGRSRGVADAFAEMHFYDYPMFATSMILILDGDVPIGVKRYYAEIFMRDFVYAGLLLGPDRQELKGNAYIGVIAKLANRYLNPQLDSEAPSTDLGNIWGNDVVAWRQLGEAVDTMIARPSSLDNATNGDSDVHEVTENRRSWQHNLPLLKMRNPPSDWTDFNPLNRVGGHFIWHDAAPFVFLRQAWKWHAMFPAAQDWTDSWVPDPFHGNDRSFRASNAKRRSYASYEADELKRHRSHRLNQVEGAGLGLLFPRMLLTQINRSKYPPPKLIEDTPYDMLPFPGATPGSPDFMRYGSQIRSGSQLRPFRLSGDDGSLAMVSTQNEVLGGPNAVIAYPDESDRLVLSPLIAVPGLLLTQPEVLFGAAKWQGRRYDKVRLVAWPKTQQREARVVVVERAEEDELPCDDHWLRLSSFDFPFSNDRAGSLTHLHTWQEGKGVRYCDGKEFIDATRVGDEHVAVMFRTRHERNRIRMFRVDRQSGYIAPVGNAINASTETDPPPEIAITSTHDRFVVSGTQAARSRFRLRVHRVDNGALVPAGISSSMSGRILDISAVRKLDFTQPGYTRGWYVVAAVDGGPDLRVHVWSVSDAGQLTWTGQIRTEDADALLVPRERHFAHAEAFANYFDAQSGFVIVGKNAARTINGADGLRSTARGLKVVYGRILEDGVPTLLDSDALGSGDEDAMVVISGANLLTSDFRAVATAHKSQDDELILSAWYFEDEFARHRWP